uniref:Uncharacterized protein n=1 Tax=viral metagenome TaxID=1070528 RepID=A0A6M3M602_9ZZZZ
MSVCTMSEDEIMDGICIYDEALERAMVITERAADDGRMVYTLPAGVKLQLVVEIAAAIRKPLLLPPAPEASEAGEPGDGKTCGECALWIGRPNDAQWVNYGTKVCVWPSAMCRAANRCSSPDLFRPLSGSKP